MNNDDDTISSGLGELGFIGTVQDYRTKQLSKLLEQRSELESKCWTALSLRVDAEPKQIKTVVAEAHSRAQVVFVSEKANLQANAKTLKRLKRAKEGFRVRHGLLRECIQANLAISIPTYATMVAVDGFVNAGFLQSSAMVATPAAAMLTASFFSGVNILVSGTAGFFAGRRLNHGLKANDPETFRSTRLGGQLGMLGFLVVNGGILTSLGLVRAQEELERIEHSIPAYLDMLHHPHALMLIATGTAFSAISFHKGKSSFADPYLGYGELGQSVAQVQSEIADIQHKMLNETEKLYSQASDEVRQSHKQFIKSVQKSNSIAKACQSQYRKFIAKLDHAEAKLRSQVTHSMNLFKAGGGTIEPEFDLDEFCSFQALREITLPELIPVPQGTPDLEPLHLAKAKALSNLSVLFEEITNL